MTEHSHRARRLLARGTLSVAVVLALSGALFAANARFAQANEGERHPQDLAGLASVQNDRVARLSTEVDDLRTEVDTLAEDGSADASTQPGEPGAGYVVEGGATPVTGPGITVQLEDAPAREGVDQDVLLVHQQDIQNVMNALWAGGAEAMTLQGQRVISTSAFWCVGNVLKLHGRVYSPPYVIEAIGDPSDLRDGLAASPAVGLYLRDVKAVGLGWSVSQSDAMEMPAYSGATELEYARVPDGVEILPGLEAAQEAAKDEARATAQTRSTTTPTGPGGDDD
ncbi:hypothetical protein CTKZ_18350 [Cellulomonas algicola]|uniref:DUF881 domain-containing protein n=1 Tax=Cellulomonas algicola TaxID=2071633 RepID=A0A401UZZ9_9CELL|nr:DUF881 domain-containing protein [Cellulomonas algicola]GCD20273.1 hypothetical protein CTKZ_18350 [Cellulomonas algicola]